MIRRKARSGRMMIRRMMIRRMTWAPVFPTGQSVRLELGRGRTTFCRPVLSSSQIARAFRVMDVGPRSPPQSPPGCYPCNVSVRLFDSLSQNMSPPCAPLRIPVGP